MDGKTSAIMVSRIIYAIQWFVLAPPIAEVQAEFGVPGYLVGWIPLSFFVGAALLQVPSAYVSSKLGAKRTSIMGMIVLGAFTALSGLSANLWELLLFRAISGTGAALFFSSAAYLLVELNKGKEGIMMGLYNAFYGVGSLIGLLWGYVDNLFQWRAATALAGLLSIIMGLVDIYELRGFERRPTYALGHIRDSLGIAVGISGVWGSYYVVSELLPYQVAHLFGYGSFHAGLIAEGLVVASILGGFMTNEFFKMAKNKALLLLLVSIASSAPLYFMWVGNPLLEFALGAFSGFFNDMAFSVAYAITANKGGALSLAFVNFMNMIIGIWLQPLFTAVSSYGYLYGWLVVTTVAIALALPLFKELTFKTG
ncbi:hypothetical protein GCM10007981_15810 [Thermocladium modestius]|uniref:Major facilitator superfamily (MFS) profile domain-containing protein n=1 Tax=Thermocladium modestius TaxID=62609 RepID=A0A830GVB3_9CREN|nr:MFS transporter [Thermocladium modestius]GGP21944.1 hypothetical protein GCM10007981_15810 [Thermocladium modestius]